MDLTLTLSALRDRYSPVLNAADWQAFQLRFAREDDAISFLYQIKFPSGFCCPRCHHRHAYTIMTRRLPLYQCYACKHQTTLTVGTIMENSRISLRKWLFTFFLVSRTDCGINATQLHKKIRVTYKTAWSMLQLVRKAISEAEADQQLEGSIQGGVGLCGKLPYKPTIVRQHQEKPVLIGASINEHKQPMSVKMRLIQSDHLINNDLRKDDIISFTQRHVKADASSVTLYGGFRLNKFPSVKKLFDQAMAILKCTFRGLKSRHLQLYLDEACYRINLTLQGKPIFENLTHLCMTSRRQNGHPAW